MKFHSTAFFKLNVYKLNYEYLSRVSIITILTTNKYLTYELILFVQSTNAFVLTVNFRLLTECFILVGSVMFSATFILVTRVELP